MSSIEVVWIFSGIAQYDHVRFQLQFHAIRYIFVKLIMDLTNHLVAVSASLQFDVKGVAVQKTEGFKKSETTQMLTRNMSKQQ